VVVGGIILATSGAVAATDRVGTFEADLFRLINHLPSQLEVPLIAIMQAGSLGAVAASAAVALAARRPRLARDLALSGIAAWLLAKVAKDFVSRARPGVLLSDVILRHANDGGFGFPSGHAAVAAALATAAGPFLPRRARHATWVVVGLVCVARIYVGVHFPADVVGGAALGWMIGATLHLIVGAPTRGITVAGVTRALTAAGFDPATVTPLRVDARSSAPFLVVTRGGRRLFVKAVDREHRNADLLFKVWRNVVFRHVEDEAPFVTPKQEVEHEALLLLLAARAGARVPGADAGVQVGSRPALLVMQEIDGRPLDELEPSELTSGMLRAVWQQVDRLQRARIAHRDLRLANIMVDADARPWIIDFGFAEVSASDHRLAQDVAELLTSSALVVGPARAVAAAVEVLGTGPVSRAIPLLQPLALSAATRSALRHRRGLLVDLQSVAAERTGTEAPEFEQLPRVRPIAIVWLVLGLFAVHVLLPMVGELQSTLDSLGRAQIGWLVASLVLSAGTYVAAAVAQLGTVVPTLALGRTVAVQVATSFANRLTPAGLGGIGVSIRYVERSGISRAESVGAAGANVLAGVIVHLALLVIVGAMLGRSQIGSVHLPAGWILLVGVVAVLAVAGFALGTLAGRQRLLEPTGRSVRALAGVLHHPRRAVELFGGSLAVTVLYIACLVCSLRAFGEGLGWARVALVYLGAAIVTAAAPTPGGLGAVEAALVAGLTALGAEAAPAIAGVLTFRLATFWLPIAPGWFAFRTLHRRGTI
jgi:undecaprenyl-diphosphatase